MATRIHTVFFRRIAAAASLLALGWAAQAQFSVPTLDPNDIPKYTSQLVIPPAMPRAGSVTDKNGKPVDYYEIGVRQFQQQILPAGLPKTTVWGYGALNTPASFNYPSFTIEAMVDKPLRVKWVNQLVDASGNYLPHLLAVDQTIHWANPGGLYADSHGSMAEPYRGPVPLVTHLHGAHVSEESDGYPTAWFLPAAKNIPAGFYKNGDAYAANKQKFEAQHNVAWEPGSATFQYTNDQRATTLWFHDHTLGMTRLNVYAGPAGFYLLRGGASDLAPGVLPGPSPKLGDPAGKKYYEIPIVIQDRSFNEDGSLFFPDSRQFFDGIAGPYIGSYPLGDISPIYNSEFFGNTIVVNGRTWPNLTVEPRRYRFRLLDGCNARSLKLKLVSGNPVQPSVRSGPAALSFWQIGSEGGFLPAPVKLDQLLVTLAERADVIVDFTGLKEGTTIYMINQGPEEPLNGTLDDFMNPADPQTTGQVMKFTVGKLLSTDTSTPPAALKLPALARLGPSKRIHRVTLNEVETTGKDAAGNYVDGPKMALLGILDKMGMSMPMMWGDPITERPVLGDTETWEIYNFTVDAHPIHLHQVQFEVLDRTPIGDPAGGPTSRPPLPWETGNKDTVLVYPGEVTRLKARFDLPGLYVWHCHIIDHEDNEMMRPLKVAAP